MRRSHDDHDYVDEDDEDSEEDGCVAGANVKGSQLLHISKGLQSGGWKP